MARQSLVRRRGSLHSNGEPPVPPSSSPLRPPAALGFLVTRDCARCGSRRASSPSPVVSGTRGRCGTAAAAGAGRIWRHSRAVADPPPAGWRDRVPGAWPGRRVQDLAKLAPAMERWATFDCYGTLIDWNGGIRAELARLFGDDRADELLRRYHELEPQVEAESPGMRYRDVMAAVLARLGETSARRGGRARPIAAGWHAFPEVPAALEDARSRGWRLAILSNTDRDLIEASKTRLGVPFDETIVASEIASYKPAPRHWEEFFARTGAVRAGHVHVAASHFHDIVPARALGLRCVWINRLDERAEPAPDRELADLAEPAADARRARSRMNVRPPHRDELPEVLALMRAHDSAAWGDSDWTEGRARRALGRARPQPGRLGRGGRRRRGRLRRLRAARQRPNARGRLRRSCVARHRSRLCASRGDRGSRRRGACAR